MYTKKELLTRLKQIISDQLGVRPEEITEESTWAGLGADSLDRLQMSLAVEDAFKVDIPHCVGERLNTVGDTIDHVLGLIGSSKEICRVHIEEVTSNPAWTELCELRTQVFSVEHGFRFRPLPGLGHPGVWHFL